MRSPISSITSENTRGSNSGSLWYIMSYIKGQKPTMNDP